MLTNDHPVVADSRPNGDRQCFYCEQPVGHQHAMGCVQRQRKVMVRFTVTIPVEVPEDWDKDAVEFHYNDSSWCADNAVDMIQEFAEEREREGCCLCGVLTAEYVGEIDEP